MQVEFSSKNGNTGYVNRLHRILNGGMQNMQKAYYSKKQFGSQKTYYLLKDGTTVSHREWYQLGSPNYVVSGSKNGCDSHLVRIISLQ